MAKRRTAKQIAASRRNGKKNKRRGRARFARNVGIAVAGGVSVGVIAGRPIQSKMAIRGAKNRIATRSRAMNRKLGLKPSTKSLQRGAGIYLVGGLYDPFRK